MIILERSGLDLFLENEAFARRMTQSISRNGAEIPGPLDLRTGKPNITSAVRSCSSCSLFACCFQYPAWH